MKKFKKIMKTKMKMEKKTKKKQSIPIKPLWYWYIKQLEQFHIFINELVITRRKRYNLSP